MAKPVVVTISHDLGREEARRRLQGSFARFGEQIGGKALAFNERWDGDRLNFDAGMLGQKVSGRIDVLADSLRIEVDLPWMLATIAEKLQGRIRSAGTLLLEKK
jgi:hypothetical protein